jgi:hypothetical protein
MIAAATALPVPLPDAARTTLPLGSPRTWNGVCIVGLDFEYTVPKQDKDPAYTEHVHRSYGSSPNLRRGDPFVPVTNQPVHSGEKDTAAAKFTKVAGSFADAVLAANRSARFATAYYGGDIDFGHAVLQATDGSYYVTALTAYTDAGIEGLPLSTHDATITDVSALIPAVKAVVGATSWVDLSGSGTQIDLSKP